MVQEIGGNINVEAYKALYYKLSDVKTFLDVVDENKGYAKFVAEGHMPLSMEFLYEKSDGRSVYGMMHFTTQNGDLMRDPDMTFAVNATAGTVEPLMYQNDFMGMYQEVYTDDGKRYRPKLRTDLDHFLWQWLKNIHEQSFDPAKRAE